MQAVKAMTKKILPLLSRGQAFSYAVGILLIIVCGIIIFSFHDYTVTFTFQNTDSKTNVETGPVRIYYTMPYSDDKSKPAEQDGNHRKVKLHWVNEILKFVRIDFDHPVRSYYDLREIRINNTVFSAPEIMKMVHLQHMIRPELIDGKILRLHLDIPKNPKNIDPPSSDPDYYLSFRCREAVRFIDYNSRLFYLKLIGFLGLGALIIYLTAQKITLKLIRLTKIILPLLSSEQVISYAVGILLIIVCGIIFLFHDYTVTFTFQDTDGKTDVETGPIRIYYTMPYSDAKSTLAEQEGNHRRVKLHGINKVLKFFRIDFDHPERAYYDLREIRINNTVFSAPEIMKMVHLQHMIRPELIDGKTFRLHLDLPGNTKNIDPPSSDPDYYLSFRCGKAVRFIDYNGWLFYLKIICFLGLAALIIFLTVKKIILKFFQVLKRAISVILLISIMILFFQLRPAIYTFYQGDGGLAALLKSDASIFYIYIVAFLICAKIRKWYTAVLGCLVILFIQFIYMLDCFAMKQFNTRLDLSDLSHWSGNVKGGGDFFCLAIKQSYFISCLAIVILSIILAGILVKRTAAGKTDKAFIIFGLFVIVFLLGMQHFPTERHHEESLYWNPFSYSRSLTLNKKYSKSYRNRVMPFKLQYSARKGLGLRRNVILLTVESLSSYQSKLFSKMPLDYLPNFDKIVLSEASAYSKNYLSASYNTVTSTFALLTGFSPTLPHYYAFFDISKFYHNPLPQVFKNAGYETVFMIPCEMMDKLSRLIAKFNWSRIIDNRNPIFDNNPRYVYDSVSDDKLFDAIICQVKTFSGPASKGKKAPNNFFIYAQTIGIHGPFYDFRSKKYSYVETVKTFDLLFADFMKKLHDVNFFRQGGILVVTGDHRVMLPISPEEEKAMGFFTPQYVPLAIFGDQPCKIDTQNLYSHVDLHYSLQWLMLEQVERHQYQRNIFINEIDKNDRKQFFCTFYQLRSNPSCMLFNTWDKFGKINLSGDDTTIEGKNLSSDDKSKIESFLLWTREHMYQPD